MNRLPLALLLALSVTAPAFAVMNPDGILNGIVNEFNRFITASTGYGGNIQKAIYDTSIFIFVMLVTIDLILQFFPKIFGDEPFTIIPDFIKWFLEKSMIFLLIKHSDTYIIDPMLESFSRLGSGGEFSGDNPSAIIDLALKASGNVYDQITYYDPLVAIGLLILCLVILLAFGFIAAHVTLIMLEATIALFLGKIVLPFAVFTPLKSLAMNYVKYAFGIAMTLFFMVAILSFMFVFITDWVASFVADNHRQMGLLLVMIIVCAVMITKTRDMVNSLLTGMGVPSSTLFQFASAAANTGNAMINAARGTVGASAAGASAVYGGAQAVSQIGGAMSAHNQAMQTAGVVGGGFRHAVGALAGGVMSQEKAAFRQDHSLDTGIGKPYGSLQSHIQNNTAQALSKLQTGNQLNPQDVKNAPSDFSKQLAISGNHPGSTGAGGTLKPSTSKD